MGRLADAPIIRVCALSGLISVATAIIVFRHRDSHNEFAVEEANDTSAGITTSEPEPTGN